MVVAMPFGTRLRYVRFWHEKARTTTQVLVPATITLQRLVSEHHVAPVVFTMAIRHPVCSLTGPNFQYTKNYVGQVDLLVKIKDSGRTKNQQPAQAIENTVCPD